MLLPLRGVYLPSCTGEQESWPNTSC